MYTNYDHILNYAHLHRCDWVLILEYVWTFIHYRAKEVHKFWAFGRPNFLYYSSNNVNMCEGRFIRKNIFCKNGVPIVLFTTCKDTETISQQLHMTSGSTDQTVLPDFLNHFSSSWQKHFRMLRRDACWRYDNGVKESPHVSFSRLHDRQEIEMQ